MSTGSCVDQNGKWNLGNRWLGCKMQGFSWQIDKSRKSMWAGAQQLEEHMELEPEPLPFCMGKCFNSLMCRMTIGEATCIFLPKSCVGKPSLFRISSIFPGEIRQKPTEWVGASKKISILGPHFWFLFYSEYEPFLLSWTLWLEKTKFGRNQLRIFSNVAQGLC
jgi:hypothetical protein